MQQLVPDDAVPGAFTVRSGSTMQSWVDPSRPDVLVFEYVQQVAIILEHTVLRLPEDQRLRIVHIGGGGLTIARWIQWRRPHTAQIVCEPDGALTDEVRRRMPLPRRSGIKVREVDGRTGLAAMPPQWADVVIVDAFDGAQVPGELVTAEAFDAVRRILRGAGVVVVNVTDQAPFAWSKRVAAAIRPRWKQLLVGAEPSVHKGRRFGNVLLIGADDRPDHAAIVRASAGLPAGYRWLMAEPARQWPGGAVPFPDHEATSSAQPNTSRLWF